MSSISIIGLIPSGFVGQVKFVGEVGSVARKYNWEGPVNPNFDFELKISPLTMSVET